MARIAAPWLTDPATRAVTAALEEAGHRALYVGGCVRNALLAVPVSDIDIATDALPEAVIAAVGAAGLKAVPTGIAHGTITVVSGGRGYEVTTFRRDVVTDGRHAQVVFSTHMEEDAARRDFTMNALYATPEGRVLDPVGGLPDLRARRLRFIGDADRRIAEDYLRILRFFRFHAWYGDPAGGLDAEGLAACAAGAGGLARVSAERIGQEMLKLLGAVDPAPALAAMAQAGILARVLPGAVSAPLAPLIALEDGLAPDPLRRLAVLGGEGPADRFRLSRVAARRLDLLRDLSGAAAGSAEIAWRHGADAARDVALLRAASLAQPLPAGLEQAIAAGAAARFPVAARDLMPRFAGADLGQALRRLERAWIASDFTLTRDGLLALA